MTIAYERIRYNCDYKTNNRGDVNELPRYQVVESCVVTEKLDCIFIEQASVYLGNKIKTRVYTHSYDLNSLTMLS